MRKIHRITFFGSSTCTSRDKTCQAAYDTARLLAGQGYTTVNGGFEGVMGASSRGAKAGGGSVLAATFYPREEVQFEGRAKPNESVDEEIVTYSYIERVQQLIMMGDAYIVFRGSTGTFGEFAMVWSLAQIYYYRFKPVILYGDFWQDIVDSVTRSMKIRASELEVFRIVNTPDQAVAAIKEFERLPLPRMKAKRKRPSATRCKDCKDNIKKAA